jgi:glutathione S-transferase
MEAVMKLYEFAPTRSIRPRWALQEMEIPFEAVTVDLRAGEHKSPHFLKVNPAGKVPVLVDGDRVISESVAIVIYLAEKHPETRMIPAELGERAQFFQWLMFAATELEQPLWRITRHTSLYPEDKRLAGEIELAKADFAAMAAVAEAHMRGREFVSGGRVSVADFVLAYTLDWASAFEILGDFPSLGAYVERMYARPRAPMRILEALQSLKRKR